MIWEKNNNQMDISKNRNMLQNQNSTVDSIAKPKNKSLKFAMIIFGLILFAVVSWVGVGAFAAISNIITKNDSGPAPFLGMLGGNDDNINANQLQGEGDGRINFLLLGVGGAKHPGGMLADTIMVASLDPENKKIAFLSIPRDLYVNIEGNGAAKINYAHAYGEANAEKTGGGPVVMKKTVANVLDLPIHYFIRVDFDGFIQLVDAMDGLTVDVKKALSDPYYPDAAMKGYQPFYLKAGTHTLDGETALKFARSRETTSDFDRAARQQQLLIAAKEKALSLDILTNPKKLTDIMKILGDHVRMDLQMWEMEKLMTLFKDVDTSNIVSKVLDNSSDGPLKSTTINGGYYLVPKAGTSNYKDIQRIAHEIFSDPYLAKENSKLEVLNATGTTGEAKDAQDMLVSYGYNVVKIDKNPEVLNKTIIHDYTGGKSPYTIEFLKKRFNAEVKSQPRTSDSVDITLILGKDYLKD